MTQTIAQYDALWQSLQTRRRRLEQVRGLDASARRWRMRMRHSTASLSRWRRWSKRVLALEAQMAALSDHEADAMVAALREVFARGRARRGAIIEAFAVLRELAQRTLGQKHYREQVIGGLALYHGQIVEMATGEGKTLAATIPAILLAWSRPSVHVVTANHYLAERDAREMGPLYRRAGVNADAVLPEHGRKRRAAAYRASVVYTTQKDLVGDWLRDQLRIGPVRDAATVRLAAALDRRQVAQVLVPGLHAVIVDEADAVLIDNAVTPLIIAAARGEHPSADVYLRARQMAAALAQGEDYELELRLRRCRLTKVGRKHVHDLLTEDDRGQWRVARRRHEMVEQALAAVHFYRRGEQYELVDGRAVMIDEFTGRFMPDRQWQHGMQQAVQAKEGLAISGEGRSLASLSFQRFFRLYPFLAGMTGTARGSTRELEQIYGAPVRVVPTHRPVRRKLMPTQVFATDEQRWRAVAESVARVHAPGRPVLVGTRSVAASQRLSAMLTENGLPHDVLNAVHHQKEAQVIAGAGQRGAITVATNMAGRGTDIKLGPGVHELGGLHVVLTELHAAKRIDEQLIGRCARQGDPGSAQIFVSFEDELLAKHRPFLLVCARVRYGGRVRPINSPIARALMRSAQRKAESSAFAARKAILRRDDWLEEVVPGG